MNDVTKEPWEWGIFGGGWNLYTRHSGAKVVLMASRDGEILVRDENGVAEPVTPDHPVAALVRAAPELLEALEGMLRTHTVRPDEDGALEPYYVSGDAPGEAEWLCARREAVSAIARAKGEP